jgi:hypothetical protein
VRALEKLTCTLVDSDRRRRDDARGMLASGAGGDSFIGNLAWIIVLGVAISGWILYFTDWFPAIGGLLALGGVFSWLAFVSKVLPDERLKALQASADAWIFSSRWSRRRMLTITAALFIAANFVGSVEVVSVRDPVERVVWIDSSSVANDRPQRLGPGSSIRSVQFTSWLWPRAVPVKVSGYPTLTANVTPFSRVAVQVPTTPLLSVPCVLLHPTRAMMRHRNTGLMLNVTYRSEHQSLAFDGHALWIGCEDDVEVPAAVVESWRALPGEGDIEPILAGWRHPVALPASASTLRGGDVILITVATAEGHPFPIRPLEIHVRTAGRAENFPQVEELDLAQTQQGDGPDAPVKP